MPADEREKVPLELHVLCGRDWVRPNVSCTSTTNGWFTPLILCPCAWIYVTLFPCLFLIEKYYYDKLYLNIKQNYAGTGQSVLILVCSCHLQCRVWSAEMSHFTGRLCHPHSHRFLALFCYTSIFSQLCSEETKFPRVKGGSGRQIPAGPITVTTRDLTLDVLSAIHFLKGCLCHIVLCS